MNILGVIESPILGPSGNKEFLIVAKKFNSLNVLFNLPNLTFML